MEEGTELPQADIEDMELEWLALTERAAEAFCDEDRGAALDQWRKAVEIAVAFQEGDPRRACSLSNWGLAAYLRGDQATAREAFDAAVSAWNEARVWVAEMTLQPRARSSLFHMRMESRHRKRYDDPARKRYLRVLEMGRAATLSNLGACAVSAGTLEDGLSAYGEALDAGREAGEDGEDLVQFIESSLAFATETKSGPRAAIHYQEFASQAGVECWLIDIPPVMTDEGRVMAAVLLAATVGAADSG